MSHKRNAKYKTDKDEWETPQWLFDLLDQEFHFDCDAAASRENTKCRTWFGYDSEQGKEFFSDGAKEDWNLFPLASGQNTCKYFLNPPYSAGNIDKFMKKAYEESQKGAVVVCLVPCATDTNWWHNYVMKAQEIRFIKGRVKFIGYDEQGQKIKNSPTFSSCVVIFDQKLEQRNMDATRLYEFVRPRIGKTIEQPRKVPV